MFIIGGTKMTDIQNTAMQNQKNSQAGIRELERADIIHRENTNHKDSLFVDLFYSDETASENLLSLYNALNGTEKLSGAHGARDQYQYGQGA